MGRGSKTRAGLAGFNVFDLLIPGYQWPWKLSVGKPHHIASSLDIMLEAPIGSAAFSNEFGRLYHGLFPESSVRAQEKKDKLAQMAVAKETALANQMALSTELALVKERVPAGETGCF